MMGLYEYLGRITTATLSFAMREKQQYKSLTDVVYRLRRTHRGAPEKNGMDLPDVIELAKKHL